MAGPERQRRLLVAARHRLDRLLGGADHGRQDHQRQGQCAGQDAFAAGDLDGVDEEGQPEEAEDDAGDPGQRADAGAEERDRQALAGVFGQPDGRENADRDGEQHRPDGQIEGSQQFRLDAAEDVGIAGFHGEKLPVADEFRIQHFPGLGFKQREGGFERGAGEQAGPGFQDQVSGQRRAVVGHRIVPAFGEEDLAEPGLGIAPAAGAILVAEQGGNWLAGQRAQQSSQLILELLVELGGLALFLAFQCLQIGLVPGHHLEQRLPGGIDLLQFVGQFAAAAPVELLGHHPPMLDRRLEKHGAGTPPEDRRQNDQQRQTHQQDRDDAEPGEGFVEQMSKRQSHVGPSFRLSGLLLAVALDQPLARQVHQE